MSQVKPSQNLLARRALSFQPRLQAGKKAITQNSPSLYAILPPSASKGEKNLMLRLIPLLILSLLGTCVLAHTSNLLYGPDDHSGARDRVEKEVPVPSKVTSATVFLEGAQVNRTTKITVPAGRGQLVFQGLTKDLDPGSIQVTANNDAFIVLSVSHRLNFNELPVENPEADKIYAHMEVLEARKNLLTTKFRITQEEEAILKQNRVVASPQTGLDADDLIAAVNFHRERITAIKLLQLALADSLSMVKDEEALLQEQLAEIGAKRKTKATAEVVVITQADAAVSSDFTLTYLVPNARWVPQYDVRVDDISQPVDLRYQAKVSQNSGEDWTNIRLTLSSGDPSANATAPTLSPWRLVRNSRPPVYRPAPKPATTFGYRRLNGRIVDEQGEPLIGATIQLQGTTIGAVTDLDGRYELEIPADGRFLTVSYTGYSSQEVPVSQANRDVVLAEDGLALQEVVVTGYSKEAKRQLAGRTAGIRARRQKKKDRLRMEAAADAAPAPVPVQVQQQATSVTFDIELPYTIPSDNKARQVDIKQHQLPADFRHLAVPKFTTDVFLTASVTNWEQYNLLPGEVQLFFEGTYLGRSQLDVTSTNDTLDISLGRDPNVLVERTPTEDYRKRNIFGNRITDSRGYTIAVRNKKAQSINLTILDQVPISGDEEIEVKVDQDPAFKRVEETGILTWKTVVAPGQRQQASFGYTVRYSKNKPVQLE